MFTGATTTANEDGAWASSSGPRDADWKALHARLLDVRRQQVRLEAIEADLLIEAEDTRLYRRLGYVTMHEFMERELSYTRHAANERLRVARELMELPLLQEAYREGDLSYSAVRELTRVATPETEDAFLEAALGKTAPEVQRLVAGRTRGDTPETPADPGKIRSRVWFDDVDGETRAMVRRARIALEGEHGGRLTDAEVLRLFARRATEPAADGPTPPAVQHAVTTCKACRRSWASDAGGDVPLTDAQAARALCDAVEIGDLDSGALTRPTWSIPASTRRKVWMRDHHACVVPGCRARRGLDVHHLVHRSRGGGNELSNLVLLCSGHHALLHEGKLVITGRAPDIEVQWVRDDDDGALAVPRGPEVGAGPRASAVARGARGAAASERAATADQRGSMMGPDPRGAETSDPSAPLPTSGSSPSGSIVGDDPGQHGAQRQRHRPARSEPL